MIFNEDESGSSSSDDDSDREDCESIDEESPSFQAAQAHLGQERGSACVVPTEEVSVLEMEEETPAFADSEDELEMSENEAEVCSDGEDESLEEDEEEDEEEEEEANPSLKEQTAIDMEEEFGNYTCFRLH